MIQRICRTCKEMKDVTEFVVRNGKALPLCMACDSKVAKLERKLQQANIPALEAQVAFLTRANEVLKEMLRDAEEQLEIVEQARVTCLLCEQQFISPDPKKIRRCPSCSERVRHSKVDFDFFDQCEVHAGRK